MRLEETVRGGRNDANVAAADRTRAASLTTGVGVEASSRFSPFEPGGLQVLWEDGGLAYCRGWRHKAQYRGIDALVVLPVSEQPTPVILDRLANEYSLKNELDSTWALRPVALVQDRG